MKAGGFHVAGTIGDGTLLAKGDVGAQTRQTLTAIGKRLEAAGSSPANAASVTVYLAECVGCSRHERGYAPFFPSNPPARTTVIVTQPLASADGSVEIRSSPFPTEERTVVNPDGWAKVPSPYSYGIKSGNTLFSRGLSAVAASDNLNVQGDLTVQTKTVLDNGAAILAGGHELATTSCRPACSSRMRPAFRR